MALQAWFCATGLPGDVVIQVHDTSFQLHKFPLMSKSKKLRRLITAREAQQRVEEEDPEIEEDELLHRIYLQDFPGGPETFESAAKFCYGVQTDLTATTAAPLRCAAEYLEMTDDFPEGPNLASLADHFLARLSIADAARVLKSCEDLLPEAEDFGLVQRSIDAIARATSLPAVEHGSWFEELAKLSFPLYNRVITAMRANGDAGAEAVESSLIAYAKRSIPGISRSSRKLCSSVGSPASEPEKRELLEAIITNLSLDKSDGRSSGMMTTRFLSGLLRTANILKASESYRTAVERRLASQLAEAALDDLLIPSYSTLAGDTLYDVSCVERIVGYYLNARPASGMERVARLVDGYLSEVAADAGLTAERFCGLAAALPSEARQFDDGVYRAVDVYMRAHPGMGEGERERVCGVVDCRKLTLEACAHAARNERLPLRAVVGVLFAEQMELRQAVAGAVLKAAAAGEGEGVREGLEMRLDMDSVRGRVQVLERECERLRKALASVGRGGGGGDGGGGGGWGAVAKRLGCGSSARVCDSHRPAVGAGRRRSRVEPTVPLSSQSPLYQSINSE